MSAPEHQRTICVLGFHRSGTSLTARVLNLLGVDLGAEAELLPPGETDNPRGYWEPRWMNDFNDELLEALGTRWWEPLTAPAGWERSAQVEPFRARARRLIEDKRGHTPLRGWKDPRLSLTLPLWDGLIRDARYVICVRNPIDAVASLQRRPEPTLSVQAWGDLWLEYTARALSGTAGRPRIVVFYEDFFCDGSAQLERLAHFVGVAPDDRPERTAAAANEIAGELRHHATSARELAADPGVPGAARMVFLSLRAAHQMRQSVHAGSDAGDAATLADAVERAAPDLWWASRCAAETARHSDALEQATAAIGAERDAARTEASRLVAELATAAQTQQELAERLDQADRTAADAHERLAAFQRTRAWRFAAALRGVRHVARRSPH